MSGVGLAVGVTAAVAAGATAYSASEQAGAAEDAARRDRADRNATNELNYRMFREGRGSAGSAILPLYATRGGRPVEPELFGDALDIYDATQPLDAVTQRARYEGVMAELAPAEAAATTAVTRMFDGGMEADLNRAVGPVQQARTDAAESQAKSAIEALADTVAEIKAINAKRGFSGDSFGEQMVKFSARRNANTQAAAARSSANLANATETGNIATGAIKAKLDNVGLPFQLQRQKIAAIDLPNDALVDSQIRRQRVFSPFVIGPGQFRYDPMPPNVPRTSTGAIVGQGIGSFAGALGGYFAGGAGGASAPAGTVAGPGGQRYSTQYVNGYPASMPYNGGS